MWRAAEWMRPQFSRRGDAGTPRDRGHPGTDPGGSQAADGASPVASAQARRERTSCAGTAGPFRFSPRYDGTQPSEVVMPGRPWRRRLGRLAGLVLSTPFLFRLTMGAWWTT
jgi:hypothetical protein